MPELSVHVDSGLGDKGCHVRGAQKEKPGVAKSMVGARSESLDIRDRVAQNRANKMVRGTEAWKLIARVARRPSEWYRVC